MNTAPAVLEVPTEPGPRCYLVVTAGDPIPECVVIGGGWTECTCDCNGCGHLAAVRLAVAA